MLFHFILARRHGQAPAYAVAVAFDDAGFLDLVAQYNALTGSGVATFAAENAELVFASLDGETLNVRHSHQFPNPADAERRRKANLLARAIETRELNATAQLAAERAIDLVSETQERIQSPSDEQKALLEEFDAEQARIAAAREQKESAIAEENSAAALARAQSLADQKTTAAASAAGATANLHDVTIPAALPGKDGGPGGLGAENVADPVAPIAPIEPEAAPAIAGPALVPLQ